ncbi:MAG TPA: hypothetical protein VGP47_09400, partial [Parachlamydiaceae bacterium]|nr:hypothetical protein [Parachlamydiaceae bacterium]
TLMLPAPLSGVHSIFFTQGCTPFTLGYWPTPPSGGIFLSEECSPHSHLSSYFSQEPQALRNNNRFDSLLPPHLRLRMQ